MASEGFPAGSTLQNAVLTLVQSAETGSLSLLHAVGLAHDANGQAAWPFARRVATETLIIDAGLARQLAWTLACVAFALLLALLAAAHRRARPFAAVGVLAVLLLAPWPAPSLILTEARATSFHRSPTGFDATSIADGLKLYETHCASCHGADGNGEGPRAASLSTWPPRLYGELLWRRAEGDLFDTVMHGMRDRQGAETMPGFAHALTDAQAWSLIDGMKALAAGASIRSDATWAEPVKAPDAVVRCDDGTPDRPLSAWRGQRLRIVAGGGGADMPHEDPRLVTMVLAQPGPPGGARPAGCVIQGLAAWTAYAEVSGAGTSAFAGTQLLVDRDGWLRAYGRPGKTAWSQDDFLCRSTRRASAAVPVSRDGLGDLIAAIDADPVRSTALGFAHTP